MQSNKTGQCGSAICDKYGNLLPSPSNKAIFISAKKSPRNSNYNPNYDINIFDGLITVRRRSRGGRGGMISDDNKSQLFSFILCFRCVS